MAASTTTQTQEPIDPEEYLKDLPQGPIFSDEPIEYIKLESEPDHKGVSHTFWIDADAAKRFMATVADLMNINDDFKNDQPKSPSQPSSSSSSSSSLADDEDVHEFTGPKVAAHPLEFRETPKKALEYVILYAYWKKRWDNVVNQAWADFKLPDDIELLKHLAVASMDLGCCF